MFIGKCGSVATMGDLFYIKFVVCFISSINIKLPPSSKKALVENILENNTHNNPTALVCSRLFVFLGSEAAKNWC